MQRTFPGDQFLTADDALVISPSGDCLTAHSKTHSGENPKPFVKARAALVHNQEMLVQQILRLEHFGAPVTLDGPLTDVDKLVFVEGGFVHKPRAADSAEVTLDAFVRQEVLFERRLDRELDATDVADLAEPVAVVLVGEESDAAVEQFAALTALPGPLPRVQSADVFLEVTFNLKLFLTKLAAKGTFFLTLCHNR